jgi:hypothetical protein
MHQPAPRAITRTMHEMERAQFAGMVKAGRSNEFCQGLTVSLWKGATR